MYKLIGKRLDGRYEFIELIGVGGMADVYRAYDNIKKCDVAVKVLKEEYSKNVEFVRRFKNESKANASLSHPNIVRIFDVDFGDKIQYIVMEYIDGVTLKEYIEKVKVLDWKDVVHFTFQILRALQHAHDKGIVHRDMKPQNIMLLEDGTIKIMDFGIARFARDERVSYGKAIGSVHYISPEQASGGVTDAKSDLYSVGIMMYEMLTGQLPFEGKTPEMVAVKQIQLYAKSPLVLNPNIPQGLVDIIIRAMQKQPEKRYQSATEMLHDIDEFKKNPDILFEYKYLNDDSSTQYFTLSEKENMKHFSSNYNNAYNNGGDKLKTGGLKKKEKLIPILLGVAAGVFLVALIIIGVFIFGRGNSNSGEIELPNFIGMRYDEIKNLDNGKYGNLHFVVSYDDNPNYDEGVVCGQTPLSGMSVKKNGEVKLVVTNGKKMKNVPDVCGLNYKAAQMQLSREGLRNVRLIKKASDSVMEDDVITTDPEAGSQVDPDKEIKIYYSTGANNSFNEKLVNVPNVVGKSLDDAKLELQKQGFDVSVVEKYVEGESEGNILSQNQKGKAKPNSSIEIVVNTQKAANKAAASAEKNPEGEPIAVKQQEGVKPKEVKSERTIRQINGSVSLVCDKPTGDTFNVVITDSSGKVLHEDKYSAGGTISFSLKGLEGSGVSNYDVRVTNNSTGKTVKYCTITVDYSAERNSNNIISVSKLDSGAVARTIRNNDSGNNSSNSNRTSSVNSSSDDDRGILL